MNVPVICEHESMRSNSRTAAIAKQRLQEAQPAALRTAAKSQAAMSILKQDSNLSDLI